ncbi:MAG: CAP domain-containing protein [Rhodothermales bacterium]
MPARSASRAGLALCLLAFLIFFPSCAPSPSVHALSELNHPGPLDEPAPIDIGAVERRVLELVNAERARRQLPPLAADTQLQGLARSHSADMAANRFFDHTNLRGEGPTQRGETRGIACVRSAGDNRMAIGIGENIFSTYLFNAFTARVRDGVTQRTYDWKTVDSIAQEAVTGWMNSRGHRLNLLSRQYTTIGIGGASDDEGQLFLTQNFC